MPHKKAKKSLRDAATSARGYDNPPTVNQGYSGPISTTTSTNAKGKGKKQPEVDSSYLGGVSKSTSRILNGIAIREEYNANKKRKREEEETASRKKSAKSESKSLEPLPYESLRAFNRRVETALRPSIDSAIKASKVANKKNTAKKPKPVDPAVAADESTRKKTFEESVDPMIPLPKHRHTAKDFAVASQIRDITDIAMAPPTLKKQRKATVGGTNDPLPSHRMPISASIQRAMEIEREKAIVNYRILKEKREAEQRLAQGKV